ncbi:MAG: hypothetical protein KGL02_03125, partial [Acidobacteriota bacterium]|nr:hypothetical protein [Acidobacteriota bacterium]
GVGYYAFARSMLIEHKLDFSQDWLRANSTFRMARIGPNGQIALAQYTVTGHLDNHFSVGPAILWAPFLLVAHAGVLVADAFGAGIAADGFSRPYVTAISLGTAFYGFLSVMLSFALARRFVPERWAFLAAVGIWFGSSLPVYMYFNPSWSHAQSAFAVALFVWYWIRTRTSRSIAQWAIWGAIAGLMMDVYYLNALLLLFAFFDSIGWYAALFRKRELARAGRLLISNAVFSAVLLAAFMPTLIVKKVIYGSFLQMGYGRLWNFWSPALLKALFSSDHGLFSWTPILIASACGLMLLCRFDRKFGRYSMVVFVAFLYTIGCYLDWDGLSSFGNRFFISLTPLFIIGLAVVLDRIARAWPERRITIISASAVALLVLWNLGLMFQWGMHLIPPRGPVSWREAAYNQVAVVPREAAAAMQAYFTRRTNLMQRIEQTDMNALKSQPGKPAE